MSLRKVRKSRGLTLRKLSELSGINYIQIHYMETGRIRPENIILMNPLKLSRALKCKPEDLLDEVSENAGL